jgi:hypothetical protein
MARGKQMQMRQSLRHAAGQWRVTGLSLQRVQPNDALGAPCQASERAAQHPGFAGVVSVARDDDGMMVVMPPGMGEPIPVSKNNLAKLKQRFGLT